jgi:hypothetical protein
MNLELRRYAYLTKCTLGRLHAGSFVFETIERPWLPDPQGNGGVRAQSCVPDGVYKVIPHSSAKFGAVWALINPDNGVWYQPGDIPAGQTWGRSAILIHAGNTATDVIGCIAVGMRAVHLADHSVAESRAAIEKLRGILDRNIHTLTIRPTAGTSEA